ncbi:AAA family ATPase [Ferrimonas gelatinilytica]|uniref:AAA family ATPase n=1 Tax=Ferrimonas gelatinilytica TaxID=1255257 RepID=A0ABP9RVQ6_9GAMM
MKLRTLTLENFRGFKHFKCEFHENLNVLVGLNGFGKTSLLDAISVAYGQFMSGFGTSIDRGIHIKEVHLAKVSTAPVTMEYQVPSVVGASCYPSSIPDFPESWSRQKNSTKKNSRTTQVKELKNAAYTLQKMVQEGANVALPLIAFYGTDRLGEHEFEPSGARREQPELAKSSRLEGYKDWFRPKSSYETFSNWLYLETLASSERNMEIDELRTQGVSLVPGNIHNEHLRALREALDTVLEPAGWSNVRYSPNQKRHIATHTTQGDMPLALLSDGVRNVVGMVADIAHRAIRLNPFLGRHAVKETEGLVLIDEVDMHLHPQWQRVIASNLSKAFPKIQFIVTSHSPHIIGELKPSQVVLLRQDEHGVVSASNPAQSFGLSSDTVLNEIMRDRHVSSQITRNKEVEAELERIFELIDEEDKEQAEIAIAALEEKLQGEIPELLRAKLSLDFDEWSD